MRCPMFSTVSRFAQSSADCASRAVSCGDGVGITKVTREGSRRTQRRQLSVFVRYCTRPHTLQRTTSRSISEILSSAFFSPTGHPHRLFRRRVGEERFTRGKAETGATGILSSALIQVKSFFLGLLILQAAKILISQRDEKQWYWPFNKPPANHAAFLIRYSLCDKEKRTWGTCQAGKMPGNYFASTRRM